MAGVLVWMWRWRWRRGRGVIIGTWCGCFWMVAVVSMELWSKSSIGLLSRGAFRVGLVLNLRWRVAWMWVTYPGGVVEMEKGGELYNSNRMKCGQVVTFLRKTFEIK